MTRTDGAAANANFLVLDQVSQHFDMGKHLISYEVLQPNYGGDRYTAMLSNEDIKQEVSDLLKRCKAETKMLLEQRRSSVERIRDELLEREELVGDQLEDLMKEISADIAASRPKPPLATN